MLRYLFFKGFYTKPIDLFFNLLMFSLPLFIIFWRKKWICLGIALTHLTLFLLFFNGWVKDPSSSERLRKAKSEELAQLPFRADPVLAPITAYPSWGGELKYMTPYAQMNVLLRQKQRSKQHERFAPYRAQFLADTGSPMHTLWQVEKEREEQKRAHLKDLISSTQKAYTKAVEQLPVLITAYEPFSHNFLMVKYELDQAKQSLNVHGDHPHTAEYQKAKELLEAKEAELNAAQLAAATTRIPLLEAKQIIQTYRDAEAQLDYLDERASWLTDQMGRFKVLIPAFFRPFHWEDDAGGSQLINQYVPWNERTRINRKDLVSSLIFGIRVSLVVGISAVLISLLIGVPLGTFSGYFAGKSDLVICRIVEIWEAMPTFFMLLLIVAITQSKSIFLVIAVLGIFGWTSFCRFIRAEVLRQRSLPYVLATKSLGYRHSKIMFSHILPNAIPPILTLLPFALMAAITSEAGLSFLGLGEEGSSSWGVLMDEGRSVFPGESYLLWPPAILLTLLLISIALIGDVLRDALDPKLRS